MSTVYYSLLVMSRSLQASFTFLEASPADFAPFLVEGVGISDVIALHRHFRATEEPSFLVCFPDDFEILVAGQKPQGFMRVFHFLSLLVLSYPSLYLYYQLLVLSREIFVKTCLGKNVTRLFPDMFGYAYLKIPP